MLNRKKFVIQWRKFRLKRSCIFKVMNFWSLCLFLIFIWFFIWFLLIFSLLKSWKKGFSYLQVLKWRAGAPASWHVARRTTARVRHGAEAMWQSRGWPTRGAGGAQGTTTWQGATHPRESTWAPVWGATWQVGLADGGPTGIVGPSKVVGAIIYIDLSLPFLPCGTMSHTFLTCVARVDASELSEIHAKASIAGTAVHAIFIKACAAKRA